MLFDSLDGSFCQGYFVGDAKQLLEALLEVRVVLNDVNITVQPGEYIALVGGSGSGKSTIISLIERFFDPDNGQVMFGSTNVKDQNLKNYRSQLALVSQSPTLFHGTIRENIIFGVENGSPGEEAVIQACKDANIYEFILSLP